MAQPPVVAGAFAVTRYHPSLNLHRFRPAQHSLTPPLSTGACPPRSDAYAITDRYKLLPLVAPNDKAKLRDLEIDLPASPERALAPVSNQHAAPLLPTDVERHGVQP